MTPSELANKIAEEVFRTIERERGIVKAEIADAVEKVLAQEASRAAPTPRLREWKLISQEALAAMQKEAEARYGATAVAQANNYSARSLANGLNQGLGSQYWQGQGAPKV